ncbi:MAG: hypothetical protein RL235_445 [Chlamydiota bacterium]|jgi:hypothetical protein
MSELTMVRSIHKPHDRWPDERGHKKKRDAKESKKILDCVLKKIGACHRASALLASATSPGVVLPSLREKREHVMAGLSSEERWHQPLQERVRR